MSEGLLVADHPTDSFIRARILGLATIIGLLVFVTIVDVIDGLFLGDHYKVDASFYTLIAGLTITFLGGEALGFLAARRNGKVDDR